MYIKAFLSPFTPTELESTPHVLVTEQDSTSAVESKTECTAELPPDSKHGPWEQDSAADKFFLGVGIFCPGRQFWEFLAGKSGARQVLEFLADNSWNSWPAILGIPVPAFVVTRQKKRQAQTPW